MIDTSALLAVLDHYGYFGLFGLLVLGIVGLPLPDETLLTLVGVLVQKGHLNFLGALLASFFGSAVGITLSYALGRWLGRGIVTRFGRFLHLTEERLLRVERYMERYGRLALFFGYFVPGLRHLTALTAGLGGMQLRIFAPFAYLGGLVWCLTFLLLGSMVGQEWHRLEAMLYPFRYWIGAFVAVSLAAPLLWRLLRRRSLPNSRLQDLQSDTLEEE